jgi:hypothetical protein
MALADTLNTNLGGIPGQVQQKTRAAAEATAEMEEAVATKKKELSAPIQAEKEKEVGAQQQVISDVGKKMAQPVQIPQETIADFSTLGGLVAIAGVMLGSSGKQSAQNVLNSMTGIMDGYKKGRADMVSNYQKEFDMNQKRMQSQIQQAQTELGVILEKYKTRDQTVAQDLAVFSAKYAKGIAATIADGQSADKVASLQFQFSQISNSQAQATARIDAEREAADKKNVIVNQETGERGYINTKTNKFVPLIMPEGFKIEGTETKAPSTVIIDNKPHQWNGKTNQWEPVKIGDKSAETLTRPGAPVKPGGTSVGANNTRYAFQIVESSLQATQDLLNVAQAPADTVLGAFSGMVGQSGDKVISSLRNTFARNLTSEDQRMLQQLISGVEFNIARALGGGYASSSSAGVLKIYEQQVPKEGDSPIVTAMFLARMKQELGILFKSFKNHPGATDGYVQQLNEAASQLNEAIPFNVSQVIAASRGNRITNTQQFGSLVEQPSTPPKFPIASTPPSTTPPAATPAAPSSATPPAAYPNARKGNDGGWYIPDPARPDKYLKVG